MPLVRIILPVLFLLCLLLWVGSYFANVGLQHNGTHQYGVEVGGGNLYLYHSDYPAMRTWVVMARRSNPGWYTAFDAYRHFGFGWKNKDREAYAFVSCPLWLPTVVLAGIAWWGWKRTKTRNAGRAFPVEV